MLDDIRRFVFLRPSKSNIDKCKKINSKCKCGPITCISGSLSQQASASDTLSKRSDATTDLTGTLLRLKQYSVVFGIATQTLSKYLNAFCESEKISATDVIVCVKGGIAFSTHLYAFVKSCRGHQDVPSTVLDALKISDLDTDVCTFVRVDEGKLGKVVAAALYDIRDQLDMLENDRHVSDTIVAAVSKAPKACPDCHAYFMNVPSVLYDPATRDWYKRRSSSMSISKNDTLKHLFGVDAQLFRLRLGTQEGEKRWPALRGHESDRIVGTQETLDAAKSGKEIISKDHRMWFMRCKWHCFTVLTTFLHGIFPNLVRDCTDLYLRS